MCIAGEHFAFSKGLISGSEEAGMVIGFKVYSIYKQQENLHQQLLDQLYEAKKVLCTY